MASAHHTLEAIIFFFPCILLAKFFILEKLFVDHTTKTGEREREREQIRQDGRKGEERRREED